SVNHISFADTRGQFRKISGTYTLDPENLDNSSAEIVVEAASVDTVDEKRDTHLRTGDFFDVEKFPAITFKSTKVERTGDNTAKLTGDVTLHGITKPVTFDVVLRNAAPHPFQSEFFRTGWSATATIKRSDFGMKFGLPLIGDEVQLNIEVEGNRV
ncbi:MAG: YceI family protein, partial [Fimbriimonadaceae bacterium]|nr:YceI family protein [Alphaproteobacteria bacterium]